MNNQEIIINKSIKPTKKPRIWELDFLRGICVLLMVWDHIMYDIYGIFGTAWINNTDSSIVIWLCQLSVDYFTGNLREIFHPIIFSLFFLICGVSCSFSRNNLLRALQAIMLAFCITLGTSILGFPIRFGVLHMLGFSMLLWWLIDTICRHNRYTTAIICFIIGVAIIIGDNYLINNNDYINPNLAFISEAFGVTADYSADYFPLMPHSGVMLIGASIAPFLYPNKRSILPILDKFNWYAPIGFWGKIALPVYILHQLIIGGLFALISYISFGSFVIF